MSEQKEIIVQAANIKEAVRLAARQLRVSPENIDIEIIDKGQKGFLGIGKKPVVVKAIERSNPQAIIQQALQEDLQPSVSASTEHYQKVVANRSTVDTGNGKDGTVEIINGQVVVSNPRENGKFPVIIPGDNVEVYVNGSKIYKETIVTDEDRVEVKTLEIAPQATFEVEITEDKMKAFVKIYKELGEKFEVEDIGPAQRVLITAKSVETELPDNLTLDNITGILAEAGVTFGINYQNIQKAIQEPSKYVKVEAATGQAPYGTEDAKIIYHFETTQTEEEHKNPYGEGQIYSVSPGDILAEKKPPVEGYPGSDVTGKAIPARPPKDVEIYIREGVELIKNGTVAIAKVAGRPVLEGKVHQFLSVLPIHVVNGDVNVEVGNIKFKGDIVVNGSVLDGFRLDAGGNITVFGNVMRAELYADKNVTVHKKAITAEIQAGGDAVVYQEVYPLLVNLHNRIDNLLKAMELLDKQRAFTTEDLRKGEGQLVQLLIDYKFKDVPRTIGKLSTIINEAKKEPLQELIDTRDHLVEKLCNLGPLRIKEKREIGLLLEQLMDVIKIVESLATNKANVSVSYAQNSRIKASGDIVITGQGCVTSELEAGGKISIPKGVVRGGWLEAVDEISIKELGSKGDAIAYVRLVENCRLSAEVVHPLVVIEHGPEKHVIEEACRLLTAAVAEEGHIIIDKLKAN